MFGMIACPLCGFSAGWHHSTCHHDGGLRRRLDVCPSMALLSILRLQLLETDANVVEMIRKH